MKKKDKLLLALGLMLAAGSGSTVPASDDGTALSDEDGIPGRTAVPRHTDLFQYDDHMHVVI